MKALAQTFYDNERWILITGSGWQMPIRFTATDIEGEYDISVDAGSTEPQNQQQLMQDRERLYQLLSQNPLVNQVEILKELLRAHGMNNPDRFIDQQAVMMQKLQQAMMMGGAAPGQGGAAARPGPARPAWAAPAGGDPGRRRRRGRGGRGGGVDGDRVHRRRMYARLKAEYSPTKPAAWLTCSTATGPTAPRAARPTPPPRTPAATASGTT